MTVNWDLQENNSFAPVLTQVKKTILGKLGTSEANDNLEDSMRKVNKYVRTPLYNPPLCVFLTFCV